MRLISQFVVLLAAIILTPAHSTPPPASTITFNTSENSSTEATARKVVGSNSACNKSTTPGLADGSCSQSGAAQASRSISATNRGVSNATHFDISPPVRELGIQQPSEFRGVERERLNDPPSGLEGPLGPQDADRLVQKAIGGIGQEIPTPSQSFDGLSQSFGPVPPDTVGAVGPNHYVQMVNSRYAVYNKTGTLLMGPVDNNTLWSGFGGPCQNENVGDPIVLYDRIANRWLLTQFTAAGPSYLVCVALSTGPDPTGSYYRWAFSTGTNFPDYPKFAVWSDAYYFSTREFLPNNSGFAGVGAYALNKSQLIAGNPSPQVISFLAAPSPAYVVGDGLLPADLDGAALPPAGTPAFFLGSQDNGAGYGAPSDALNIWKFSVNFASPGSSSFTLASTVAVAAFDSIFPCGPTARECIPQPGTAQKIDHQGYRQRLHHRAAYRNFGTYQAIVTNQSVEAATGMSGIRWYEIRSPNSGPTIFQQGTYAPGVSDGIHRWMGSIAQDKLGNMGLGYSVSNGVSTFPGVRYTGRLVGDPLGTMPQGEEVFVTGGGSQTSTSARWGDYSAMTIDPSDDCTFWYTTEYYATTSSSGWRTRIGSFKFPSCTGGGGNTPPSAPTNVNAVAGNGSITVNFGVPASSSSAITGYSASCTSSNGGVLGSNLGGPSATSIMVNGLTNLRSYTCTATASNSFGAGTPSAPSNAVIPTSDDGFPPGGSIPVGWIQPTGSNAAWIVTSDSSFSGTQSLKSGRILDNQKSEISYTGNFSGGNISFARRVSSEPDFDVLEFFIDGIRQGSWSGEVPWSVVSFPISDGQHNVLWRYRKDFSFSTGLDAAWIDSVQLPSISNAMSTFFPVLQLLLLGDSERICIGPGGVFPCVRSP